MEWKVETQTVVTTKEVAELGNFRTEVTVERGVWVLACFRKDPQSYMVRDNYGAKKDAKAAGQEWLEQCQIEEYYKLEDQLDIAIAQNDIESDEAEAIRCRMDTVWKLLTQEQQNKVKGRQS
jgi:hypothetical protein